MWGRLLWFSALNIFKQPILENAWAFKAFCCGCPYEKYSSTPSKSTLKYGSKNRPFMRGFIFKTQLQLTSSNLVSEFGQYTLKHVLF